MMADEKRSEVMDWLNEQTKNYPYRGLDECFLRIGRDVEQAMSAQGVSWNELARRARTARRVRKVFTDANEAFCLNLGTLVRIANALSLKLTVTLEPVEQPTKEDTPDAQ